MREGEKRERDQETAKLVRLFEESNWRVGAVWFCGSSSSLSRDGCVARTRHTHSMHSCTQCIPQTMPPCHLNVSRPRMMGDRGDLRLAQLVELPVGPQNSALGARFSRYKSSEMGPRRGVTRDGRRRSRAVPAPTKDEINHCTVLIHTHSTQSHFYNGRHLGRNTNHSQSITSFLSSMASNCVSMYSCPLDTSFNIIQRLVTSASSN